MSQGEKEAFELINKCRFMHDHLPPFLQQKLGADQLGWISFPSLYSEVVALPSTEKAGRSHNATVIINDEYEYHEYAEKNYSAIKPTVGKHGKFICMSTADTEQLNTFFKKLYVGAKNGENEFIPIFLPATSRPDRSVEDVEKLSLGMSPHKKQGEYPMTEEDALTIVKTRRFFDEQAITRMRSDISEPIKHELTDKFPSIRVWKLPVVGRRYCMATDPSDGKEDPHATIVMDAVTGEGVAESHGKLTADKVAQVHDALARYYNNALNTYELNARAGGIMSEKLKDLDTPNQCPFLESDGKLNTKGKKGWWTSGKSNEKFLYPLEEAVRLGVIVIHSKDCLDELGQYFIKEGGEPQHPDGGHDDYISAWARTFYMRRFVQKENAGSFSFKYRE